MRKIIDGKLFHAKNWNELNRLVRLDRLLRKGVIENSGEYFLFNEFANENIMHEKEGMMFTETRIYLDCGHASAFLRDYYFEYADDLRAGIHEPIHFYDIYHQEQKSYADLLLVEQEDSLALLKNRLVGKEMTLDQLSLNSFDFFTNRELGIDPSDPCSVLEKQKYVLREYSDDGRGNYIIAKFDVSGKSSLWETEIIVTNVSLVRQGGEKRKGGKNHER